MLLDSQIDIDFTPPKPSQLQISLVQKTFAGQRRPALCLFRTPHNDWCILTSAPSADVLSSNKAEKRGEYFSFHWKPGRLGPQPLVGITLLVAAQYSMALLTPEPGSMSRPALIMAISAPKR